MEGDRPRGYARLREDDPLALYAVGLAREERYGPGPAVLEALVAAGGRAGREAVGDDEDLHAAFEMLHTAAGPGGTPLAREYLVQSDTPVGRYYRLCRHLKLVESSPHFALCGGVDLPAVRRLVQPYLRLEAALGYSFAHCAPPPPHPDAGSSYLLTALNREHPPAPLGLPKEAAYQKLEFFGDSILAAAVREELVEKSAAAEGVGLLNDAMKPLIGNREALPEIGAELELGPLLRLGVDERDRAATPKMLADAVEALLAAVHLDYKHSGRPGAAVACAQLSRQLVLRLWDRHLRNGGAQRSAASSPMVPPAPRPRSPPRGPAQTAPRRGAAAASFNEMLFQPNATAEQVEAALQRTGGADCQNKKGRTPLMAWVALERAQHERKADPRRAFTRGGKAMRVVVALLEHGAAWTTGGGGGGKKTAADEFHALPPRMQETLLGNLPLHLPRPPGTG